MPLILFLPSGPHYPKEGWRMLVRLYNPCHLDTISDLFTLSHVPDPSCQPQEVRTVRRPRQKGEQEYVCMAGMSFCAWSRSQCGEEQVGVLSSA